MITHRSRPAPILSGPSSSPPSAGTQGAAQTTVTLIRKGVLPANQLMPSAPWQILVAALDTEQVRIGVQEIAERRPTKALAAADERLLRLPGL